MLLNVFNDLQYTASTALIQTFSQCRLSHCNVLNTKKLYLQIEWLIKVLSTLLLHFAM